MVDAVIHRHEIRQTLSRLVRILTKAPALEEPGTAVAVMEPAEEQIAAS
jgi:acetyl-CoA carboxylase beta subunit